MFSRLAFPLYRQDAARYQGSQQADLTTLVQTVPGQVTAVSPLDDTMIALTDVSVRYSRVQRTSFKELVVHFGRTVRPRGEFWALRGINIHIHRGEVVGIIGRNGAGKSTLLGVISHVLKPVTGTVIVRGRVAPLLSLGAAFDPELTGRENVYLNAALLGFTRRQVDEQFDDIVAFAELQEFIDAPLRTYSSGMGARLGFAIATAAEADVLLVDELLAVGDEHFRRKCLERMSGFRSRHMTIVLVTHDMHNVLEMCTRAVWLDLGHIMADGDPQMVVKEYHDFITRGEDSGIR